MATDVDRIAEVIAGAIRNNTGPCTCDEAFYRRGRRDPQCVEHAVEPEATAGEVIEALQRNGWDHVPTALHQAADAWQQGEWADTPRYPEIAQDRIATANHVTAWLRARADRVGGDHV